MFNFRYSSGLRLCRVGFIKISKELSVSNILLLLCLYPLSLVQAQIQTDSSLGTAQSLTGPDFVIDETLGRRAGSNLFHSFKEFNLHKGESATFQGANEITNIISRVTGGKLSNIDGLIKSDIANANLYLINPSGIIFGRNASLSISGSFHASTADFIRLGDTDSFYSEPLQGEILSTAAPHAFGFFGAPEGNIIVKGSKFDLNEKATFSLVAGGITITEQKVGNSLYEKTSIRIPQGQINLIGVDSAGEVSLNSPAGNQDLTANDFTQSSMVRIEKGSELNVDGEGGGKVVIRGGQLVIKDAVVLSARTSGEQDGRGVDITAGDFEFVRSQIDTTAEGTGNAGEIQINTKTLELSGLHEPQRDRVNPEITGFFANSINSDIEGGRVNSGKAGTIKVAADQMNVRGEVAFEASAVVPENTGIIDLSTSELTLDGFDARFQFDSGIGKIIRYEDGNIILDGTLHPDKEGTILIGPNYEITTDMGQIVGNNLFYSFQDFFVDEGEFVTLFGTENTSNIIMRVTGDSPTGIYGNLISNSPEANHYLINPNGLFFGPGFNLGLANLFDIPFSEKNKIKAFHSFNFTTADHLILENGGRFDASDPVNSELTSGNCNAYGFVDKEIGEIVGEGSIFSLKKGTLSLVGGDMQLENSGLFAPFGHINLVSLESAGEVHTLAKSNDLETSDFSTFGDITLYETTVSVLKSYFHAFENESNLDAGRIFVRGNNLQLDNSRGLLAQNFVEEGAGSSIDVNLTGNLFIGKNSSIAVGGTEEMGHLTITAENITIDAFGEDPVLRRLAAIDATQSGTFVNRAPVNDENSVEIEVRQDFNIINGGQVDLANVSSADAKNAIITAKNLTIDSRLGSENETGIINRVLMGDLEKQTGLGNGGQLFINIEEHLQILDGGQISTSTLASGNAGNITITAKNLTIDGRGANFTGINSIAAPNPSIDKEKIVNGGSIDMTVGENLQVVNGGNISAFATKDSAGNLSIKAGNDVYVADSVLNISAGQENFDANDLVNFQQPELRIEAGNSIRIQNSTLSTNAGVLGSNKGAGGDIYLSAHSEIWLENSTFLAQAGYAGGNAYIDTNRYIVISSDVIARSDFQGGNYNVIVAGPSNWIQSADSLINLSGEQSGSVLSNTSPFDLGAELSDLSLDFLDAEDWVSQPCNLRPGGKGSSFVVTSWKGVSNNADDFLPSEPILLADYDLSETELNDKAFLQAMIFPELKDECEDCP